MSSLPDPATSALDFLKGKENPFASLARPQRLDDYFLDLHVPQLLATERKQIWQIIDHYRVTEYTRTADLPPTAVVTILGDRGAGKTHLLQSLSYREDGKSQLLVRPSFLDSSLAIEEFLLNHLVATLLAVDEVYGGRPIDDVAAAMTRRLLRQSIRALGPTDRLFARSPGRWHRLRLLMGGGQREGRHFDDLAHALETTSNETDLRHLIDKFKLTPAQCYRVLRGHLQRFESGTELLSRLRLELYAAMARTTLFDDREYLHRLLEGEYTQLGPDAAGRADTVNRMLHAVTEVCAMVQQPIVFTFDNLERLFNPENRFDENLVRAFWNSLAQVIDCTKGLLILLFAERGLFERVSGLMDSFAQARIGQGVPVFGRGPVHTITLNPPATEDVAALVNARMGRVLGKWPQASELPPLFPFQAGVLEKSLAKQENLRNALIRLRDEYSRVVYEQAPPMATPPLIKWDTLLESRWQSQLAESGRKLSTSPASHRQALHAGIGAVLQRFVSTDHDGWQLTDVVPTASIGDNPTYGLVSVLTWRRVGSTAEVDPRPLKLGVGFLLAQGNGMAPDLQAKFDFFRRPVAGDQLLILWYTQRDGDDLVEALPDKTRDVWKGSRTKKKTSLRRLDIEDLRALLAFPEWLNSLAALAEQPPPAEMIRSFCVERFQSILELVSPPETVLEKEYASENC